MLVFKKSAFKWCLASLLIASFLGCVTTEPVKNTPHAKKVALVLGGGGARGFAHVGVIRELESAQIPIDMIVGVSVGSLIGALYADCKDSFKLEWKAFKIEKNEIFDFKVINIVDSLAKGEAIQNYIDKNIESKYLQDMKIPLAVVAADLKTGLPVVFLKGPVKEAVRASTSVPGVFAPLPYGDKLLVDGGVLGNLAPQVAKDMGADIIIGVNIAKARESFTDGAPNALVVILESIEIMGSEIVRLNRSQFNVMIEPEVGKVGILDFSQKKELIEAGRQAAQKAIPEIKKLLE